jgi:hypothetical protein
VKTIDVSESFCRLMKNGIERKMLPFQKESLLIIEDFVLCEEVETRMRKISLRMEVEE